jgi:hypothetical protein
VSKTKSNLFIAERNKLNIVCIQPALNFNEYYSLINPVLYFSDSDINYRCTNIQTYNNSGNLLPVAATEIQGADIVILPQYFGDLRRIMDFIRKVNPLAKIVQFQDYDINHIYKSSFDSKTIEDLTDKNIVFHEYANSIFETQKNNIDNADYVLFSTEKLQRSIMSEDNTNRSFVINPIVFEDLFTEGVDHLASKSIRHAPDQINIVLSADSDNHKLIDKFLIEMIKRKNIYVSIIGQYETNITDKFMNYKDPSIIHWPKLITEITPDIFIDFTKTNESSKNTFNEIMNIQYSLLGVLPLTHKSFESEFTGQEFHSKSIWSIIDEIKPNPSGYINPRLDVFRTKYSQGYIDGEIEKYGKWLFSIGCA